MGLHGYDTLRKAAGMKRKNTMPKSRRINRGKLALKMNNEGMSFRQIALKWGVADVTVLRWIKEYRYAELRRDGTEDRKDRGRKEQGVRKQLRKRWPYYGGLVPQRDTAGADGPGPGLGEDRGQVGADSE